jgi:rod shape-determining protein MreC
VLEYFHLKQTNDSLVKANEKLYNQLKINYVLPDSITPAGIDTIRIDSASQYRLYHYQMARVVSNSVSTQSNYMVLAKGAQDGLKIGMGVVDINNAVVGIITEVYDRYAVVMSLLHKDSHISGKLLKGGETGTLNWDGADPNIISLSNVSKSAKVHKGDTIITSGFSTTFPKGLLIGSVQQVFTESSSNNYKIDFNTIADFQDLSYVYVIDNTDQEAVLKILHKLNSQH